MGTSVVLGVTAAAGVALYVQGNKYKAAEEEDLSEESQKYMVRIVAIICALALMYGLMPVFHQAFENDWKTMLATGGLMLGLGAAASICFKPDCETISKVS